MQGVTLVEADTGVGAESGMDGSWGLVDADTRSMKEEDARGIGGDDGDGGKEAAAKMLPCCPSVRTRVGGVHHNRLLVPVDAAGVVLLPEEGMRRHPFPDGMDNVGSLGRRNAAVLVFLVAPGWLQKRTSRACVWFLFPELAVVDRTCNECVMLDGGFKLFALPKWGYSVDLYR